MTTETPFPSMYTVDEPPRDGWFDLCLFVAIVAYACVLFGAGAFAQEPIERERETTWSKRIADKMNADAKRADFAVCEFRLPDDSRVDIQTPDESIEVEWCHNGKWKEAIGQALFYSISTGKKPAIILLTDPSVSKDKASIEYLRCKLTAEHVGIRVQVWETR